MSIKTEGNRVSLNTEPIGDWCSGKCIRGLGPCGTGSIPVSPTEKNRHFPLQCDGIDRNNQGKEGFKTGCAGGSCVR